jgi:NAD(P)-dependent dehydrogenase (short-subunit alcohol dehydrogenase family)
MATIAWITGAGRGIGREIALRFARHGMRVAASARSDGDLDALRREAGDAVLPVACDVTSEASVDAALRRIRAELGEVALLVNNAGTTVFASFLDTDPDTFDRLTAVNLRGAYLCTRAVLPAMRAAGGGSVVMINSVASRDVLPNSAVYAATKAGLKAMTDCLRLEYRREGLRFISVYPGATNTGIWPERVRAKYAGAMMTPADVADAVLQAVLLPPHATVEDLYLQPVRGPLS